MVEIKGEAVIWVGESETLKTPQKLTKVSEKHEKAAVVWESDSSKRRWPIRDSKAFVGKTDMDDTVGGGAGKG